MIIFRMERRKKRNHNTAVSSHCGDISNIVSRLFLSEPEYYSNTFLTALDKSVNSSKLSSSLIESILKPLISSIIFLEIV